MKFLISGGVAEYTELGTGDPAPAMPIVVSSQGELPKSARLRRQNGKNQR